MSATVATTAEPRGDRTTTASPYEDLAVALAYPTPEHLETVTRATRRLAATYPRVAQHLEAFRLEVTTAKPGDEPTPHLEEVYMRTFDLSPSCVPYVSVHLFGEDSFKRAELMARLAKAYLEAGLEPGSELPDHLEVLLRLGPRLGEERWRELARWCLLAPVAAMVGSLEGSHNPYRHVLAAVQTLLETHFPEGAAHA